MALYKRQDTWWVSIYHQGERIQKTTGTSNKAEALRYHDQLKSDLWRVSQLQEKPKFLWDDAVERWGLESKHKKSLRDDLMHLRWLDPHFCGKSLLEINRNFIEEVAVLKEKSGVRPSTVNRMLALIRSILRKAAEDWEWLDKAPKIRMREEGNKRIRWITREEAARLLQELPVHLARMVTFSLATGLRQSNVLNLKWKDIDLERRHTWVHPDEAKAKKAIAVPLNETAMAILLKQKGENAEYVFTYAQKRVKQCNTKAWKKALKRSGIQNFRWHDLRHTWASWHVQNGTSLQELQQLGGWASYDMVLRYAHLSSNHLKQAAERVEYRPKESLLEKVTNPLRENFSQNLVTNSLQ